MTEKLLYNLISKLPQTLRYALKEATGKMYYRSVLLSKIKKYPIVKPKKDKAKNILFINTIAGRGGAAKAAYEMLCEPLREQKAYNTDILVAEDYIKTNKHIHLLKPDESKWQELLFEVGNKLGYQDFFHLNSFGIKGTEVFKSCDILHLHNMHGGYFSPFALPELTALKPTIWTLHDEHTLTGHCACFYDCEKWITGCENCPDLAGYPEIENDSTNLIWHLKQKIYENSNITFVCPSNWLKTEAQKGLLKNQDIRLIPNGIDENIFYNFDKIQMRKELGLPIDKKILMFSASGGTLNPQKGGWYIKQVVEYYKNRDDILLMSLGTMEEKMKEGNFLDIAFTSSQEELAKYYSASDLFIYPTLTDNLPFVVLESLSCGTPVISFNTGGVPEEIEHMKTGYIANYKDTEDFIKGIDIFLNDENLMEKACKEARKSILKTFTKDKAVDNYINLYDEIYEKTKKGS
ncbi:MAG: glycosyltransferase [Candidatus Gastranaerophilaceae bacterium]